MAKKVRFYGYFNITFKTKHKICANISETLKHTSMKESELKPRKLWTNNEGKLAQPRTEYNVKF